MAIVRLKPGHVRPVYAGHPWIFAQAIGSIDGAPLPGDEVVVVDPERNFLGRGFYSPKSAIPVRLVTHRDEGALDDRLLGRRVETAMALRRRVGLPNARSTGYRLVNSEGDQLPGLVVDVYGRVARVQVGTAGMARRLDALVGHIARVAEVTTVLSTSSDRSKEEGFELAAGVLRGPDVEALEFVDRGLAMRVPLGLGQKTGYYFDQRAHRAWVEERAAGLRVLDAYAYVGAFGHGAARGGAADVLSVDSSNAAVSVGVEHALRFGHAPRHAFEAEDVKALLERCRREDRRFDLVVLDPPKLARSGRDVDAARHAYRKINAAGLAVVEDGGLLVTCSCSAAMRTDDFLRTVAIAAADVRKEVTLVRVGEQAEDHPVPAAFDQGRYLTVACFRVLG